MTNQSHPITPPPELVEKVSLEAMVAFPDDESGAVEIDEARDEYIAQFFAQWGADQEHEASCEWLSTNAYRAVDIGRFRHARRPKPPNLKQQALAALDEMQIAPCVIDGIDINAAVREKYDAIRHALQLLPDNTTY